MSIPLRVLLVEDREDDAALVLRELRRGDYEPTHERVETAEAMRASLEKQSWDIVLSDHNMPYFNSSGALRLLQNSGLDIPFIIVSGAIGEDAAVAAMKAGAHDYILKGNLTRLNAAIKRELEEAEVRRARRRAAQEERRLHRELEKGTEDLQQRLRELTALNKLFQEHLSQRFMLVQEFQEMIRGLEKVGQEIKALADRARQHTLPNFQDLPGMGPDSGDTRAGL